MHGFPKMLETGLTLAALEKIPLKDLIILDKYNCLRIINFLRIISGNRV